MIPDTANASEITWLIITAIGFIFSCVNGYLIHRRGRAMIRALRVDGATKMLYWQRVARAIMFDLVTGLFFIVAVIACLTPDPNRSQLQIQQVVMGSAIGLAALLITVYTVIEALMRPSLDDKLEEAMRPNHMHEDNQEG